MMKRKLLIVVLLVVCWSTCGALLEMNEIMQIGYVMVWVALAALIMGWRKSFRLIGIITLTLAWIAVVLLRG